MRRRRESEGRRGRELSDKSRSQEAGEADSWNWTRRAGEETGGPDRTPRGITGQLICLIAGESN